MGKEKCYVCGKLINNKKVKLSGGRIVTVVDGQMLGLGVYRHKSRCQPGSVKHLNHLKNKANLTSTEQILLESAR